LYTKATTSIEPSDAPLDATIHWTPKDSLVLTWEHPNVANGDIKFFTISIAETEKETNRVTKMFNATDKRYSLRYQYEARVHLLPSTRYTISISANNGCEGKEVTFKEMSPPSTPKFETVPRISSVGDKIVLETVSIRNSTDQRVSQRRLYVLVLDQSENDLQFSELLNSSASRVVLECKLSSLFVSNLIIGDYRNVADCDGHLNVSLQLGSCYNITIILTNSFANKRRQSSYSQFVCHSEQEGSLSMVLIYWPLSIALIFLLVVILYIAYRRKSARKHLENQEIELSNPLREGPNAWNDDERGAKIYSKPVKTTDFLDYVKSSWKNGDLVRQHEEILNEGSTYETITENLWLDYIDTEFMDGQQVRKSHLAGKVPEPDQFALFWKLIWNENITHIILLDNCYDGDETSAGSYWLVNDEDLQRHNLFLSCDSCDIFADYECRRFILTYKKTSRHIVLYRYCSWSNTSTPLSSLPLMPFFQTTSKIPLNPKSPILVQCSTGVEGTGFALLCDLCLRTASRDGTVDVLKTSHRLVKCDENLANNTNYYLLAHLVILEKCLKIDTSIKCDSFNTNMPMILSDRATHQFFKYVANTQWLDEKKYETKNKPVRKVHFIASYGPDCDDVSASWDMKTVGDFRCVGKFTLTKEPKPDSLFQFWNMIANKDISMIVSLNKISALQTWPDKNYSQIVLSKYITLEYQNSKTFKCYDWITAKIIIGDTTKTIEIIAVNNWSWDGSRPEDVSDFVNFCNETNTILKKSNSVLVMSHNGIKDSGLYIAMLYNMKKMEVEGVCDVPTSVRMVRRHSPEFAVDEKQFTFLFEAARNYLREVRLYEVN
jgi:protein tyrosine phosphatase